MRISKFTNKIGIFLILIVILIIFVAVFFINQESDICKLEKNPAAYLGQNFTLKGEVVHKYAVFVLLEGFRLSDGNCEVTVASDLEVEIGDVVEVSGQFAETGYIGYYLSAEDSFY